MSYPTEREKENYEANLDLERYNYLMSKVLLTDEEAEFCLDWDNEEASRYLIKSEIGGI